MTDDIVTRLQWLLKEGAQIIKDQADEIERLRNQVRQLEGERDQWQTMAVRNGNH